MKTISLRVPNNFKAMLEILAESEDRTVTDFIKHAVKDYIENNKHIEEYVPNVQEQTLLKNVEKSIKSQKTTIYNPKDFD